MCLSNEAAAIKLAERDNLVGELVNACEWLLTCMRLAGWEGDDAAINARAVIAKAREGAQS